MRRFPSLRYVMTSNVPFEKNKMASTLAASVINHYMVCSQKCKEAERRVKFKESRKRGAIEKKLKSVTNFLWETTSGKAVLQISYNNKRCETETRNVE